MANVTLGTGPWVIDTASSTAITSDALQIDQLLWVPGKGAAADSECKVTDNSSTPLVLFDKFTTGADVDEFPLKLGSKFPTNGLIVPTLDAGKLYVYFK